MTMVRTIRRRVRCFVGENEIYNDRSINKNDH